MRSKGDKKKLFTCLLASFSLFVSHQYARADITQEYEQQQNQSEASEIKCQQLKHLGNYGTGGRGNSGYVEYYVKDDDVYHRSGECNWEAVARLNSERSFPCSIAAGGIADRTCSETWTIRDDILWHYQKDWYSQISKEGFNHLYWCPTGSTGTSDPWEAFTMDYIKILGDDRLEDVSHCRVGGSTLKNQESSQGGSFLGKVNGFLNRWR